MCSVEEGGGKREEMKEKKRKENARKCWSKVVGPLKKLIGY